MKFNLTSVDKLKRFDKQMWGRAEENDALVVHSYLVDLYIMYCTCIIFIVFIHIFLLIIIMYCISVKFIHGSYMYHTCMARVPCMHHA